MSETTTKVEGGIVAKRSEDMGDWFTIEKAEHDGRQWLQPSGHGVMRFMLSCRISDACVEGTWSEMRALMEAIRGRGEESFKRCAVRVEGDSAFFWSPRNSTVQAEVSLAAADAMAERFLSEFPAAPVDELDGTGPEATATAGGEE